MKCRRLIWLSAFVVLGQHSASSEEAKPQLPSQLMGKSIVITYVETRKTKPDERGEFSTRKVPFKLIVYASSEGNLFNRLIAGKTPKSSDQTRGTKDPSQFADRQTLFDKQKLTVANKFGGGKGSRTIEAAFDDAFSTCTATVVVAIEGEFARQRRMQGGTELLYAASESDIACAIVDGNQLAS